jgi:uncharacterized protein (TIGR03000 family)
MQVIRGEGSQAAVFSGYWGFRVLARQLRLLWPVLPLFSIPGAGSAGPFLYHAIARNRARRLGCYTRACAMHCTEIAELAERDRAPLCLKIKLPADAKLYIQNQFIAGQGRKRLFTSKPARYGKDYVFDVRIEVVRDGVELTMSQLVRLRAGQPSTVKFRLGAPGRGSAGEPGNGKEPQLVETEDHMPCPVEPLEKVPALEQ